MSLKVGDITPYGVVVKATPCKLRTCNDEADPVTWYTDWDPVDGERIFRYEAGSEPERIVKIDHPKIVEHFESTKGKRLLTALELPGAEVFVQATWGDTVYRVANPKLELEPDEGKIQSVILLERALPSKTPEYRVIWPSGLIRKYYRVKDPR